MKNLFLSSGNFILFNMFLVIINFIPISPLEAILPESTIVEINHDGMTQPPYGTYLSFIRTEDGRVYGVEDFAAFSEMKWNVGEKVKIKNVAHVESEEMFPQSKVLLTIENRKNDEDLTVILLKHPISRFLHSSIESLDVAYPTKSDHSDTQYYNRLSMGRPNTHTDEPFLSNVKLFDGRVYGIKKFRSSSEEQWKQGDAVEEDYVVTVETGNKGPQVVILLRNLSQDTEAEAVMLKDADPL